MIASANDYETEAIVRRAPSLLDEDLHEVDEPLRQAEARGWNGAVALIAGMLEARNEPGLAALVRRRNRDITL
jgi:hypothetical protein